MFSQSADINQAACDIAKDVAEPGGAYICGGVSPTPTFEHGNGDMEAVKREFRNQCQIFVKNKVDFLIGEVTMFYMLLLKSIYLFVCACVCVYVCVLAFNLTFILYLIMNVGQYDRPRLLRYKPVAYIFLIWHLIPLVKM